jgi:hypothetical protein
MSSLEHTNTYISKLTKLATDPFELNSRGELSAPMNEPNVSLYTANGSESVTLQTSGTASTSAVVVFDPEASLRTGQCAAYVIERFQSGGVFTVNAVTQVAIGRPSSDFTSAGVFSGGLSVENTSSVDTIAGFQTQAVLYSVPSDIVNVTSTELRNSTTDSESDLAQANCKDDGTVTTAFPYHYGQKMALMRTNTSSHQIGRTYDVMKSITPSGGSFANGIITNSNTDGAIVAGTGIGILDHDTGTGNSGANIRSFATTALALAADAGQLIFDSNLITGETGLFTLATAAVEYDFVIYSSLNSSAITGHLNVVLVALDAAGNTLASQSFDHRKTIFDNGSANSTDTSGITTPISGRFDTAGAPIARIIAFYDDNTATQTCLLGGKYSFTTIEQTSDVPSRPVHVAVLDGLNSGATLTVRAGAVLTGVPDSTNSMIAGKSPGNPLIDHARVDAYMRTFSMSYQHAFLSTAYRAMADSSVMLSGRPEFQAAMHAFSFGQIGKAFRDISKEAKKVRKGASSVARAALPIVDVVAPALMMSGNPAAQGAGAALMSGAELARASQRAGLLE